MPNSVDQECSRCSEKPAGNSGAIGKGFDAADAAFLINPEGAAYFDACPFKPLAIGAASRGAAFTDIHSKSGTCRIGRINKS